MAGLYLEFESESEHESEHGDEHESEHGDEHESEHGDEHESVPEHLDVNELRIAYSDAINF